MKETSHYYITSIGILLLFSFHFTSQAQVSGSYSFKTDTVALGTPPLNLPLAGGTTVATGGPNSGTYDHVYGNIPLGFEFKFNGKFYTSIGISSNGFCWFGNTPPATNEYNPVSDNFTADGVISVFGASLTGRNYVDKPGNGGGFDAPPSTIKYETIGTAPNQIFIVEWNNFTGKAIEDTMFNDTTLDYNNYRVDMWVALYQCSNVVEPLINANLYPWFQLNNNVHSMAGECGIRGKNSTDFYNTSATCQPVGSIGFTCTTPTAPTGSNATQITLSTNTCIPGTVNGFVDFTSPIFFTITGGNPQAWIYTPASFSITSSTSSPNPVCTGSPETVTVNATGGTSPYTVNWTASGAGASPATGNSSGIISFPDNSVSTSFTNAGTGSFNFTYTDSVGCTASGTVNGITVNTCTIDTVNTGTIVGSPFCSCGTVNVPFTSKGIFNNGNLYTAQISDSSGSFTNPVNIGSISSTANSGTISNCIIPCNTISGNSYRIRVVSSNPGVTGTDNGVNIVIVGNIPPTINIFVSPTLICSGGTINCTATAQNALNPHYQWLLNGQPDGTDSSSFITILTNPTSSDSVFFVRCIVTSTTNCGTSVDTSNTVPVTVSSINPAAISITAAPNTNICPGTQVTFTATPVNGGPSPTYQWYLDNAPVGSNSNTYSNSALNNNDSVYCIITSSNFCANPATGTSNTIIITVSSPVTPSITISASPTTICIGGTVTFAPQPTNGGASPGFTWQINGVPVSNAAIFTVDTLTDSNDVINCIMTTSLGCVTTATATSNNISIKVITAPVLNITPISPLIMCTGTPEQITVTGADTYTWSPATGLSCVNCSNPIINASVSAIYTVVGTVNNCTSTDSIAVVVRCPGNFVPSAFSPNGDDINDVLKVLGPPITGFDFKIFNRWGELVFETNVQDFGWDGNYKLEKAPMGVYVWELSGIDKSGNKVLVNGKNCGNVTLLR